MNKVYIAGGLRTHIGLKNGIFKNIPAEQLAAALLMKLVSQYQLAEPDEIICGNAVGTGGNITRLMALEAGIAASVPCLTIDMQCASAAEAIAIAIAKIKAGMAEVIIAGGFESSSMQPTRVYCPRDERYTPEGFTVAQFTPETTSATAMLEGAERTASQEGITRAELDKYVVRSHAMARQARESKILEPFIASVCGSTKDEGIRDRMSERLAAKMPLLLGPNTTLTAANACLINDGAAFVIVASERWLQEHGTDNLYPRAELVTAVEGGVEANCSPRGALAVGNLLLEREHLSAEQIDAFEYNEAFAVITAMFAREYPQLLPRYNQLGGALAYGHPYGASGAILVLHLLAELEQTQGDYGLVAIAGAGGLGTALLLKRVTA